MDFKNYLKINDTQRRHTEENLAEYKRFSTSPEAVHPKVIVNVPNGNAYTTPELIADKALMLKNGLDTIQTHIDIGDDYIPQVRVEFGTGQVSHAYGCDMYIAQHSPVCAQGHVLSDIEEIDALENPSLTAGWFGKCYEFTEFFMENKPSIVGMQLPDFQSPFNNAHLIRGNDILLDFYDSPDKLRLLLQKVTDYMVTMTDHYRKLTHMEEGFFCDWGVVWKGSARLSNCSLHMISTAFYNEFVKDFDRDYLDRIGGGRIHYCGEHDDGLFDSFFSIPNSYGVDYDSNLHDLWNISAKAPSQVALLQYGSQEQIDRLLKGERPEKNNFIISAYAKSIEEGRILYQQLKAALH